MTYHDGNAPAAPAPRVADFGHERQRTVLWALRDPAFINADLTDDARLLYAIGCVICDDNGAFTQDDLDAATSDPSVVQYARNLLTKAASA